MPFTSSSTQTRERFYLLEAILGALVVIATVGAFELTRATEELDSAVQERQGYCAIHDRSNARFLHAAGPKSPDLRSAAVGNQ